MPVLCVTNRLLCSGDFLRQVERVLDLPEEPGQGGLPRPAALLLREKDLDETAYGELAGRVDALCQARDVPLVVHSHVAVAHRLKCRHLHLTLPALQALPEGERQALAGEFELSTSCHSADDARVAAAMGCSRIIAGHVYATDSKRGLPPRGLPFMREVCAAVNIPVWAIGGVVPNRLPELRAAGATGACMMSAFMR